MKTNKSFSKRLKVTRTGKIVGRKAGQNHFNAKEGGRARMSRNRTLNVNFKNKAKARFLNGA
jgi:ribosomal protein L35